MNTPAPRTARRPRLEVSLDDLRALIALARRTNQLAAEHGVAVDEARQLARAELATPTKEGRS